MEENLQYQKKKDEFTKYYQEKIRPQLEIWEKRRLKYLYIFYTICLAVLIWIIVLFTNFNNNIAHMLDTWGLGICFLILFACGPLFLYYQRSKESILPLLINFFGNFSYQYRPKLPLDILQQSKITKIDDFFQSDDTFYGEYGNIKVNIIEYVAQEYLPQRTTEHNNLKKNKKEYGIFFLAQMNKKFSGQTIVVEDKGLRNRFIHYKDLEHVHLEDPVFEKAFEVYGNDQIEARYILTTAMIEQMLQLKTYFAKISFSFFAGQVLMNVKTKKNYFECSNFFRSLLNEKRIEKTFAQMYALFSIIRILQLDQNKLL